MNITVFALESILAYIYKFTAVMNFLQSLTSIVFFYCSLLMLAYIRVIVEISGKGSYVLFIFLTVTGKKYLWVCGSVCLNIWIV